MKSESGGRAVVVGVDGSGAARRGLLFAADLASRLDAELVVVHVRGLATHIGDHAEPAHGRDAEIEAVLENDWCADLHEVSGLRWRSEIIQSQTVEGLIRAADDADAGLIVVGSHGTGKSDIQPLGSTSRDVVRNSHLPVVVVPPADNHPSARPCGSGAMNPAVADS